MKQRGYFLGERVAGVELIALPIYLNEPHFLQNGQLPGDVSRISAHLPSEFGKSKYTALVSTKNQNKLETGLGTEEASHNCFIDKIDCLLGNLFCLYRN